MTDITKPEDFSAHAHMSVSDLSLRFNVPLNTVADWLGTTTAPEPKKGHHVPHTSEAKAKISAAHKGKKLGPQSEEHKAKAAAARRRKKRTPEQRARMSEGHKGRKHSPDLGVVSSEPKSDILEGAA
jgi:NUMOD3 motif